MDQENLESQEGEDIQRGTQQRRVKVTGAAAHRTGERRAAVKPHKKTTALNYKEIITTYLGGLRAGSFVQSYAGDTLVRNGAAIRKGFGLAADDELILLTDPTATGRAGVLLSTSGVHLADGRGGTASIAWKDLKSCKIGVQRNAVVIGQSSIQTKDAQALASLLQHVQSKITQ